MITNEGPPTEPEDYVNEHFKGFLTASGDEVIAIRSEDTWEYEVHTDIPDSVTMPKIWLSDNAHLLFEITGTLYANSKKSILRVYAQLWAGGDCVDEELKVLMLEYPDHWFTKEEIVPVVEAFAYGVLASLTNGKKIEW